eukprot:13579392-Alexandrium_andersonii.AAC.1
MAGAASRLPRALEYTALSASRRSSSTIWVRASSKSSLSSERCAPAVRDFPRRPYRSSGVRAVLRVSLKCAVAAARFALGESCDG